MSAETAPLIAYEVERADPPADRLLRLVVGWAAIADGGKALLNGVLHVALSRGWAQSPSSMSWDLDGTWSAVMMAAQAITSGAQLISGVMMLRGLRSSVLLLRLSLAGSMALAIVSLALLLHRSPTYASYWSTPATAAVYTLNFVGGLWLPILLLCLTLRPLARRMGLRP